MFLSILCVSCVLVVFPGQTQREGGWINGSRAAVVEVENYGAVISNNYHSNDEPTAVFKSGNAN